MVSHPTKEIRCRRIGEACVRIDHPSGLPIFLCPKPGYRSSYAVFATRYGSLDTTCRDAQGKVVPVPEGIAHYLEHKLFENEDCDAFHRYAATGASANAYTSFDHTAYLFTLSLIHIWSAHRKILCCPSPAAALSRTAPSRWSLPLPACPGATCWPIPPSALWFPTPQRASPGQ